MAWRRTKLSPEPMLTYLLSVEFIWTNFSEISLKLHEFSFMKMRLKISFAKYRSFCSNRIVFCDWLRVWHDINYSMYISFIFIQLHLPYMQLCAMMPFWHRSTRSNGPVVNLAIIAYKKSTCDTDLYYIYIYCKMKLYSNIKNRKLSSFQHCQYWGNILNIVVMVPPVTTKLASWLLSGFGAVYISLAARFIHLWKWMETPYVLSLMLGFKYFLAQHKW